MYRNLLISVSCDWETVKNVVTGNSSSKPDRTGRGGKFVKQSKMLNNSAYSRLGNKLEYFRKMILVCFYGISLTSHRVIRSIEIDGVSIFS